MRSTERLDSGGCTPHHRIRTHASIRTDRIGQWRSWPAGKRDALWSLVEPLAVRFGYAIDG